MNKDATIRQEDGKWYLYAKDGKKRLGGPYDSRDGAVKRERQVQHFKHVKGGAFEVGVERYLKEAGISEKHWDEMKEAVFDRTVDAALHVKEAKVHFIKEADVDSGSLTPFERMIYELSSKI
jgi:hypothetical protein